MNSRTLLREHLGRVWRDLSNVENLIENIDFNVLSNEEMQQVYFEISKIIDSGGLKVSGPDRIPDWESGWDEVLVRFNKNPTIHALIPQYFGKHKYGRLDSRFIGTNGTQTELIFLRIVETQVLTEVMNLGFRTDSNIQTVYEFGCGTGHNLLHFASLYPDLNYFGLDWSQKSQELLKSIKGSGLMTNLESANFNFYNPDSNFKINPNSIVFTIATLEQVGSSYNAFIQYLLSQQPKYVIHIEPEQELLNPNNAVDQLSISYSLKRGYLQGLLKDLRKLESNNELQILNAYRIGLGSYLLDGYSVIVWEPRK